MRTLSPRRLLLLAALAVAVVWMFNATKNAAPTSSVPATPPPSAGEAPRASTPTAFTQTSPTAPTAAPQAIPSIPAPRPIPAPEEAPPPPSPAVPTPEIAVDPIQVRRDLDSIQFMLRDYRTVLGGNPVGTNAEIVKALLGDNAKQLKVEFPGGQRFDADGALVDRWGTPYFFHQLSGREMEIRTAGADRIMWTHDDIVTK